jgi:hypothetical protein
MPAANHYDITTGRNRDNDGQGQNRTTEIEIFSSLSSYRYPEEKHPILLPTAPIDQTQD